MAVASASGMATVRSEELTKLTQTLVADSLEARIGAMCHSGVEWSGVDFGFWILDFGFVRDKFENT